MIIPAMVIGASLGPIILAISFVLITNWGVKRIRQDPDNTEQRKADNRLTLGVFVGGALFIILALCVSATSGADDWAGFFGGVLAGDVLLIITYSLFSVISCEHAPKMDKTKDNALSVGIVAAVSLFPFLICLIMNAVH